jgi:crotonobetainyl-CoA:carnitine CoA-transferase CaiB-like acyl-CoA transferase
MSPPPGALGGVRVLDVATLFAGPFAARILGDHGAEVIKVHGLWWKVLGRNKLAITLDLSKPRGQELLRGLVAKSDVLIENFRPGVMERWGLGWEALSAVNPRLVMLRVTGFGQLGPYASRPGFGTLAEAMSGFAHITGQPDGPPTLPPFGLADGIAGLAGATAVMMALYHRDLHGAGGQMIDLAIIEPILHVLGAQPTVYDQLGVVQQRTGNRSANNAPRNTYRTRDGRWVAISTSADRVAERVMRLVGHPEVVEEPWFATGGERAAHAEELDRLVGGWVAERTQEEVIAAFTAAGAAVAPLYDVAQVLEDPQYQALASIVSVEDEDLGPIRMQNQLFRMAATPGRVKFPGRRLGQDNEVVYTRLLGLTRQDLAGLRQEEVV